MPTIHLSLPEWIYEELKRKADDMGVQITDLVKFFIKMGIEGSFEGKQGEEEEKKDDKYAKLEENIIYLEARMAQLETLVGELIKKFEEEDEEEEVEIINRDIKK
ncbi:hypothetical protein [Sulfolobus acidocaldarius]|uniref:Conserved protein n=4 Tax=Sulfolobus acidocaldarius TaxID=2285 RepID=Q4JA75_SULAC|nr:hypothetical protein [Sulfolobus acidocaldarius]AAY80305.1 conserved protein [Sulfolobus acidocaldarius DSM 639]AGE70886.1 hypothetical protein SacN8_04575 [Sulfolobus acidocaldarius N8]AGE73157.1 hypothetical protein SacRon12I_04565 [Sulfolobus acidocaldarius Ron12/I]ALU28806.1 hypothetical protein ATY89_01725 [Sulfolobus acidocaldarius]ALU31526.1 hypothetical protein ATZ20_04760 [Sulfolobus acidocaldarius]